MVTNINNDLAETNNNFDMQTLVNLVGQNAMAVSGIMTGFNETKKQLGLVATQMVDIKNDVSSLNDRMYQIENNEEITTEQVEKIKSAANTRIREILGKDENQWAKYSKTFYLKIYSDARMEAGLGSKIDRTRKHNFQRVMNYLESWYPKYGISELMQTANKRAAARRKAKEEGYDC